MTVHPDYKEFVTSLNKNRVKYLIVGAHALGFHGIPRYTKDIDFWIDYSEKNILHFLKSLQDFFGTDFRLSKKNFKKGTILQFGREPIRIDVLTSISGITFKRAWRNRIRSKYGPKPANYLSLNDLIHTKRSAGRKQDLIDLEKLLKIKKMKGN